MEGEWKFYWGVRENKKRKFYQQEELRSQQESFIGRRWINDGKWRGRNVDKQPEKGEKEWNRHKIGREKEDKITNKLRKRLGTTKTGIIDMEWERYAWLYKQWRRATKEKVWKEMKISQNTKNQWKRIKR